MKNVRTMASMLFLLLLADTASGHGLRYQVTQSEAVVVQVSYHNKEPFALQNYEIFRPGESTPCFSGRTDSAGRIVFLPDSSGSWLLKAYSQDGHGLNIPLETSGREVLFPAAESPSGNYTGPLLGLVIILGLFNMYTLFIRRKQSLKSA